MVLASICERASTAFYFANTSCDHICLSSSEQDKIRNSNPFSISHVVLVTCYSYKNGIRYLLYPPFSTLNAGIDLFLSKNLHVAIDEISSNRESEHASNCENLARTSKRAPVQFLRANPEKAKFCEHLKIVRDHLISLICSKLHPPGILPYKNDRDPHWKFCI